MKQDAKILVMVLLALVTIYGIVTGRYLFLVFMIPLGSLFKKSKTDRDT